jgi:hypothetical protein
MSGIEGRIPKLLGKFVGVEAVAHPTDGYLVAHACTYFAVDHQMSSRIFRGPASSKAFGVLARQRFQIWSCSP